MPIKNVRIRTLTAVYISCKSYRQRPNMTAECEFFGTLRPTLTVIFYEALCSCSILEGETTLFCYGCTLLLGIRFPHSPGIVPLESYREQNRPRLDCIRRRERGRVPRV